MDGKYSFSLSESELLNSGIRIGREYSKRELDELHQRAVLDKAYMRSLDYLARRPRSEWELRDYLKRKEYEPPTIDTILNKLSNKGYVNDTAFATAWVASRRALKPTSLRKLRIELMQKHVGNDVIEHVLAEDETAELDVLKQLVAKKRHQSRYKDDEKLIQYLARQGFRYDDIKNALQSEEDY